ncbi:hypothetical protein BDY19DRAFT_571581 [Irpex rosettiformis]|uniref:Uncharacterized protein n=1 Tax=Irpex rosettiformis TaxID=378272 RepID=A0ACB8UCN2_9APHY|nr:hypothetical protein BDY19DRAFT_571581 [Irpex rosettiformis]
MQCLMWSLYSLGVLSTLYPSLLGKHIHIQCILFTCSSLIPLRGRRIPSLLTIRSSESESRPQAMASILSDVCSSIELCHVSIRAPSLKRRTGTRDTTAYPVTRFRFTSPVHWHHDGHN